jgi:hypothetical protein
MEAPGSDVNAVIGWLFRESRKGKAVAELEPEQHDHSIDEEMEPRMQGFTIPWAISTSPLPKPRGEP